MGVGTSAACTATQILIRMRSLVYEEQLLQPSVPLLWSQQFVSVPNIHGCG